VSKADDEVEDILRQMAQIRVSLHHEMRNVVAGAEAAFDWRSYVRRQPLTCLGVAFALGYILMPGHKRSVRATAKAAATEAAERVRESVVEQIQTQTSKPARSGGIVKTVLLALTPVAVRFAQGYALQFLESALAPKPATRTGDARAAGPAAAAPAQPYPRSK